MKALFCLFMLYYFPAYENSRHNERYFEGALQTVPDHRQEGHQLTTIKASTLISCAQLCLAEAKCVSTNYGVSAKNEVICELNFINVQPLRDTLTYSAGFLFSYYGKKYHNGVDIKKGCLQKNCQHDGQCYFDHVAETFHCACKVPWTGQSCETKIDRQYNFTSLNTKGRSGPKNNMGYRGTSLEGITVQKGIQSWTVPFTAEYSIVLCGATGGDVAACNTKGGRGARVQGRIRLQKGTQLRVLVGQEGSGGGGGSFVVFAANSTPLAVAGGGGAADLVDGDPGQAVEKGSINGGRVGRGGNVCVIKDDFLTSLFGVGAGAGFKHDGHCFDNSVCNGPCVENDGGKSFSSGGQGGANKKPGSRCAGGFGGGGNCGGGGGYSGGGVEVDGSTQDYYYRAGGGGSFLANSDWTAVSGGCPKGSGFVFFEVSSWINI